MFKHVTNEQLKRAVMEAATFDLSNWNHCIAAQACAVAGYEPTSMEVWQIRNTACHLLGIPLGVSERYFESAHLRNPEGELYYQDWPCIDRRIAVRAIDEIFPQETVTPEQVIREIQAWPLSFDMRSYPTCIAGFTLRAAGWTMNYSPLTGMAIRNPDGVPVMLTINAIAAQLLGIPYDTPLFYMREWPVDLYEMAQCESDDRMWPLSCCPDTAVEVIKRYFCMD